MFQNEGASDVEDFRGRGSGFGLDCSLHRNDCGLGAADPTALRVAPSSGEVPLLGGWKGYGRLGKRGRAGVICAFRVDTSPPRHHHRRGESAYSVGFRSLKA